GTRHRIGAEPCSDSATSISAVMPSALQCAASRTASVSLRGWLCGVAFEALQVPQHAFRVVGEDRLADEFEQGPEDPAASVAFEVADPDHLDSTPARGWARAQLPATAGLVDVRVCNGGFHRAGLGPVVFAAFPVDADAGAC